MFSDVIDNEDAEDMDRAETPTFGFHQEEWNAVKFGSGSERESPRTGG